MANVDQILDYLKMLLQHQVVDCQSKNSISLFLAIFLLNVPFFVETSRQYFYQLVECPYLTFSGLKTQHPSFGVHDLPVEISLKYSTNSFCFLFQYLLHIKIIINRFIK